MSTVIKQGGLHNAGSFPSEAQIDAYRYWPVEYSEAEQLYRLKISGFFLSESKESAQDAFETARRVMSAYCKVPLELVPERFTNQFVRRIAILYREVYSMPHSESKFWLFCEALGDDLRYGGWADAAKRKIESKRTGRG